MMHGGFAVLSANVITKNSAMLQPCSRWLLLMLHKAVGSRL